MRLLNRSSRAAATRVDDPYHLTFLLDAAERALGSGDLPVAITHLAQAVYVAATKGTDLADLDLFRRVKSLIDAGGGLHA